METFGILGGDRRQLYLARSLKEDGFDVSVHGLELLEGAEEFPVLSLEELGRHCQVVLLPLPATRDGAFLNAPYGGAPASGRPPAPGFAGLLCAGRHGGPGEGDLPPVV